MPSLGEAYDRNRLKGRDPRSVLAGCTLLAAGALALLVAIVFIATAAAGAGTEAKQFAGTLAGLGIPAMLLGVVVVLPASRRERVGVLVGAALTVVAVGLFWEAYPHQWTAGGAGLTFETTIVYFVGGVIALWYVFTTLATFHRRNSPHGTVQMEVVYPGQTRTVEVSEARYSQLVSDGGDPEQLLQELEE